MITAASQPFSMEGRSGAWGMYFGFNPIFNSNNNFARTTDVLEFVSSATE
jgi:hypothetical protein